MFLGPFERIKDETIMSERQMCDEKHLCTNCNKSFKKITDWVRTTQDEHSCPYAYQPGVVTEDNGGGYWVIECPNFEELDTSRLYKAWMRTEDWLDIRTELKEMRAGYKCEICGSAMNICVHHTTYENLCRERRHLDELLVVCKDCHRKLHEADLKKNKRYGDDD